MRKLLSISRRKVTASMRHALPAPCTSARSGDTLTPSSSGTPSIPSLPTRPISSCARAVPGVISEMKLSIGKYT